MASDGTIKITTELNNDAAQKAMSKFGKIAKKGCKGVVAAVATVGTTLTVAAGYAVKTGIEFESAFAGVKKTVNATTEELGVMREGIRDMAKEIPQSAASIAEVAEAAGQLGIQNKNILSFTRTMSDLGVATNMSSTEAATSLARLANITQMPQENFDRLGSTVVDLGNNLATTESEIVAIGLRLAGAGKQVGMSEAKILGLGAAISSVGIEADAGGSAVSTVIAKIQLAVEKGGESLKEFADVAGMSSKEFQQAFRDDASQALVAFITGLGQMEEKGQSAIKTLDDMDITEIRQRDALLRLAGAGDVLSNSLGIATKAWDENNALTNEAAQRYETVESKIQLLKNNVADFGITIYDNMRDPLANTVDAGIEGVSRLQGAFTSGGLQGVVREAGELFNEFADNISDTSDEAKKIVTPLKNVVNEGAKLAGDVLPVLADGTLLIAENLDVLVPLITSSVVAFKTMKVVESVSKWYKKASAASVAYSAAMTTEGVVADACSTAHILLASTMSASELVVGVLTGKVSLATAAQVAWNAALNANPIGLAIAAVAALAAGLVALDIVIGDSIEQTYRLSDGQKKVLNSCEDTTNALNEQREAREEAVQSIDREYDGYESLVSELESITDANGKVKAGYEDRAKVITGLLSDALGTEISMTDGVIDKYKETISTIKELIVQKKAEALASSMQDEMAQAYEKSEQAIEDYKNAQAALEEQQKKVAAAEEAYRKGGPAQKKALEEAEADQKKLEKALRDSKTAMQELSTEVNNYDALMDAMASGDITKIEEAMNALVTSYQSYTAEALKASEETRQEMYDQANSYVENMKLVQDGTIQVADSVYQDMAKAAVNSINEFNKLPGGIAQGIKDIGPEASSAMIQALAQADLDGKLDAEAKKDLKSFISGFDSLDDDTRDTFAQAWYGALEGLEGFEQLADPAKEGADAFLESLMTALEVHSPSAAVARIFEQVWPGASHGLDSGQDELTKKANSVIQNFLTAFSSNNIFENARGVGQKIMQFFGIGVSSQSGNSQKSGQANASAAKAGAASVNPMTTGYSFGLQYAIGVGSKTADAKTKGENLATNADSGARTKSGYDAGSSFGSGFVNGIGSWISKTASKAAELANSALNAAKKALDSHSPSKKSRKLGRTVPQGLGLGIEDDTKLVEKASEGMSQAAMDAIDINVLSDRLKQIDIPSTFSRVYAAMEDKQSRVAEKITSGVEGKISFSQNNRTKEQMSMSEEDIQKLARAFSSIVSKEISKNMEGMGFYARERELFRMIREVK